jgi:hypothetical protein
MKFIHPDYTNRINKQMKININQLINKWIMEGKLNDQALGEKVRHWFWREGQSKEHWLYDDDEEMSGYGYDDASRSYDDGEDEIY